ncbi:MAG: GspH/FimT family pseudopilin [Sedimentisphaerales bacterium]|nr:GspH/FimT family pseudopilin [Sedimentisphaerales bacterium]
MTSSTGPTNGRFAPPANGDRRRHSARATGRSGGSPPGRGRSGFTLLELVLVMLILCTVLAIAAPNLRGFFASREAKDAAEQIVALTQLASSQAVAEGRAYRLNLNIKEGFYWLSVQDEGVYRPLYTEQGRLFSLPRDTIMEVQGLTPLYEDYYIEFDPTGRSQAGRIRLVDRRGDVISIICPTPTDHYYIAAGEDPYYQWN